MTTHGYSPLEIKTWLVAFVADPARATHFCSADTYRYLLEQEYIEYDASPRHNTDPQICVVTEIGWAFIMGTVVCTGGETNA